MTEPIRRTTPAPLPDLISEGNLDSSEVLFRMTRRHANLLGAYLNGRKDTVGLPQPLQELLDALTLRLVAPTAGRWNELKKVLDGQSPVTFDAWHKSTPAPTSAQAPQPRHRRYDGGPNAEDLREDLRNPYMGPQVEVSRSEYETRPDPVRAETREMLLGDADGTLVSEVPIFWQHFANCDIRMKPGSGAPCTCALYEGKL